MTRRTRKPSKPAGPTDRSLRYIHVTEDKDGLLITPRRNNGKRTFMPTRRMTRPTISRMKRLLDSMTVTVDISHELITLHYYPK